MALNRETLFFTHTRMKENVENRERKKNLAHDSHRAILSILCVSAHRYFSHSQNVRFHTPIRKIQLRVKNFQQVLGRKTL